MPEAQASVARTTKAAPTATPTSTPTSTPQGPLAGIRVLDLTIAMAGPLCTQRLGEMGAEVIKVEAPGGGDFSRKSMMAGITKFGDSACYVALNRNKRSIVLDLKTPQGREVLYRMARQSDVLVQNFRPAVATRLGIDFATLHALNPRLVVASVSGYGKEGPMASRPGQDLLLQSFTGLTYNGGQADGLPQASPLYMVDTTASHLVAQGILAALLARERGGEGQEVNVTMLGAIMEMQIQEIISWFAAEQPATRTSTPAVSIWMEPPYGLYNCQSGHLALAQADLDDLAKLLALPRLAELKAARPPQAQSQALADWRDEIYRCLAAKLCEQDAAHWESMLDEHGIWCAQVNDYAAFLRHPQTSRHLRHMTHPKAGEYITTAPAIAFSTCPEPPLWSAPAYGADTREVLARFGFEAQEIETLLQTATACAN